MKIEKMLHTIGQIDDDLIEDALIHGPQKKIPLYKMSAFRRAVAVAACFVLIVGIALSMPTLFKPNTENPSATPTGPTWDNPDVPGTLLPPSVQENDQQIRINSIDKVNYFSAIRILEGVPKPIKQSPVGGNYGISLLSFGYDTDRRDEQPETETTGPDATEGPPVTVTPDSPAPPDLNEDIYYYEFDPEQPFYFSKVHLFQIELTDETGFLASKLGTGIVDVVITHRKFNWDDDLITFRNGENYYSCLSDSWGYNPENGARQWDFSTHKYVEGFYLVKNLSQENYAFYIDMNPAGQVTSFECHEAQNGGYRPDQNVKIVSDTVTSAKGGSFTIAELEEYFNSEKSPDETTPPTPSNTNLEFWIAENVDQVDFSKFHEKYGMFGGNEYYGTGYVPTRDEHGQQVDPKHYVLYTVTSYPDYADKEQHITHIYITDPNVEFYGISLNSSFDEFTELIRQQGFEITESNDIAVKAEMGSVWVTFTAQWIRIGVEVTNEHGTIF